MIKTKPVADKAADIFNYPKTNKIMPDCDGTMPAPTSDTKRTHSVKAMTGTEVQVKKKRNKTGESATSPRRIAAVEVKQLQALEYRKMGYTYAQIAEAMSLNSSQAAHYSIQAALTRIIREPAEDVLKLDLERLDALFSKPYQDALQGDLMALNVCLGIMARRAKLLGLDAPVKREVAGHGGGAITAVVHNMTEADMDAAARRLLEKF